MSRPERLNVEYFPSRYAFIWGYHSTASLRQRSPEGARPHCARGTLRADKHTSMHDLREMPNSRWASHRTVAIVATSPPTWTQYGEKCPMSLESGGGAICQRGTRVVICRAVLIKHHWL